VRLLDRARTNVDAAIAEINGLDAVAQAETCLQVHPERRHELLELLERPADVVPLLPELELVRTLLGGGLADTHWLLEHATPAQHVACVDLHCWRESAFDRHRFRDWLDAMLHAGSRTLCAALTELDLETWVMALRDMASVSLVPSEHAETEDGLFYFSAGDPADADRLREIVRVTLAEEPNLYLRLVTALFNETTFDAEEHALHGHRGRMLDMGFPDREAAMWAYRPLRPEAADSVEPACAATRSSGVGVPLVVSSGLLAQALSDLPEGLASEVQSSMLAVGNALAIADQLELTAADTGSACLERALCGIERGLQALTAQRGRLAHEVLAETRPLDLFRIGFTLDPSLGPSRRAQTVSEGLEEPDEDDPLLQGLLALIAEE